MFLRITRGQLDPAQTEKAIGLIPDIMAAVQRQPGCQNAQAGIDRTTGTSVSISTFDTMDHAQFSRDSLGEPITRLQALGWQGAPPEIYEIVE